MNNSKSESEKFFNAMIALINSATNLSPLKQMQAHMKIEALFEDCYNKGYSDGFSDSEADHILNKAKRN